MAITSELIGKLGGGSEVESWDVSGEGLANTATTLATIPVASGEKKMLILIGQYQRKVSIYDTMYIQAGDGPKFKPYDATKPLAMAQVLTSTTDVVLKNDHYTDNSFSGTIYLFDWAL